MKNSNRRIISRRTMLAQTAALAATTTALAGVSRAQESQESKVGTPLAAEISKVARKGRIKQSICRGCLRKTGMSMDEQAAVAKKIGIVGMDLVKPADWDTVKKHGLVATMVPGAGGQRPVIFVKTILGFG